MEARGKGKGKGTVTSLSSMFPAEEAHKASARVQHMIAEKHVELQTLQHFVDDNSNLINLVQRLPDQLHHQIMVPFGKAAFFPGHLVHTNEFTVLLGEGYYAERTAKQTVDILNRRGKTLESQVDSLKAVIDDFKAEASFFDRTAAESAEGLLEIREDYEDDDSMESESDMEKSGASGVPEVNNGAGTVDEKEYARMLARFDELEKEELEAEDNEEQDDEHDENVAELEGKLKNQCHVREVNNIPLSNDADKKKLGNSTLRSGYIDESSQCRGLMEAHMSNLVEKDNVPPPILKSSIPSSPKLKSEVPSQMHRPDVGSRTSRPVTDSLKAFTGTIVERADNLQEKQTSSQPSSSQPSKPVSRFKMQRR